ncbi:MAG: hypothetical protein C4517_07615 [Stygiobacter sp.]|nr:MAG: hypothetical protein A2237_13315 [Stygiobacter sp. RIFOXYA2_FULL_38_8]RJQ61846.1 MAG: hypothetical protein C4517_07615 [Stygiobacter sp.]
MGGGLKTTSLSFFMIFKFNKVYIIESLPENEMKTGKSLYEEFFHHNDVDNRYDFEYQSIKNANGFKTFLEIVFSEIKDKGVFPIIHFEMHGGKEGLRLSSSEVIQWKDLAFRLLKMNIELKNKLVVVFALCYGVHFLSAFYEFMDFRTPFAGLIASTDYVKAGEIKYGFQKFYKMILETKNGNDAIKGLNELINEEDRRYSFLSCRWLFKEAFVQYLKLCSAKERNKRTERIITKIKSTNPNAEITKIRKELKEYLHKNNQEKYFITARDKFLMYDLDGSNKSLFAIEYHEIMGEKSTTLH